MTVNAVSGSLGAMVKFNLMDTLARVLKIARDVLKALGEVLAYPTRYLGAKNWSIPGVLFRTPIILFNWAFLKGELSVEKFFPSHYSNGLGPELNQEETKEYLRYVSYGLIPFKYDEESWSKPYGAKILNPRDLGVDPSKIKGNITLTDKVIMDRDNLFKAVIIEDDNELVVSFGSMNSHWDDFSNNEAQEKKHLQLGSVALNLLGKRTLYFEQANDVAAQLKVIAANKNKRLVLTGQSFGGALAAFAGINHQVKTVSVNAVQLGAGLQQILGDDKLSKANQYVDHVTIEGEVLNLDALRYFDTVLSLAGIRTPGNFGRRFKLRSYSPSMRDSHDYPMKSFMQKMNYDTKARSNDLKQEDIVKSRADHE